MKERDDHYREAVRLLDEANVLGHTDPDRALGMMIAANTHATLASINDMDFHRVMKANDTA